MNKIFILLAFLSLTVPFALVGCGTAPKPTSVPTLAPVIITVIVTATPPSAPPTPEATITPTGTLTTTTGAATTQTLIAVRPTNTAARVAATLTRRPATAPAASPTSSPLPMKYGAVKLSRPIFEGPNPGDQRDERHYPSDSLSFEWLSNGALGDGECYEVRVDMKSNADGSAVGDAFIQCDTQETQKSAAQTVRFILNKPSGPGPTYAALIPSGAGDLTVSWSVTIVKDAGVIPSGGAYAVDGSRHRVAAISPRSQIVSFPLKGANP